MTIAPFDVSRLTLNRSGAYSFFGAAGADSFFASSFLAVSFDEQPISARHATAPRIIPKAFRILQYSMPF